MVLNNATPTSPSLPGKGTLAWRPGALAGFVPLLVAPIEVFGVSGKSSAKCALSA